MKLITKLQSYTDVITNSSSTVFLMKELDAKWYKKDTPGNCCDIELIDEQWIKDHCYEWQLIFDYLKLPYEEVAIQHECWYKPKWLSEEYYWEDPDPELWHMWLDYNMDRLKGIIGLYFVEIHDHFEDSYEYIDNAGKDALITDYRH